MRRARLRVPWVLNLCAVLFCSSLHPEIPRHFAFTHPQYFKILSGIWPDHPVFQDEQCFERMARELGPRPSRTWKKVEPVLKRTVKALYPAATISLEGSHSDGTAVQGISDYDVWIDTPLSINRRKRKKLFHLLLTAFQSCGLDAKPRLNGIHRKAMKFQIGGAGSDNPVIDLDVVCLHMKHDVGFNDHDYPLFTRCVSREQARREARRCTQSDPWLRTAISAFKGLSSNGRSAAIPGFFLNHFAWRLCSEGIESPPSSLVIFQQMVESFFSFCRGQDIFGWPPEDFAAEALDIKSKIWMDLWRDSFRYDYEHQGSNRVGRLRQTCKRARDALCRTFQAIVSNDTQSLSNHIALKNVALLIKRKEIL
eukprot:Skav232605  [mRNA]  locus=scaffold1224:35558:36658:+ [translate_table: standard]